MSGVLDEMARRSAIDAVAYAVTWRGRSRLGAVVPAGVRVADRPMAARMLRGIWRRSDVPPLDWWIGPVDVVHGTNFVAPPTRRAAAVATVHDLTPVRYPELSTRDTLHYPGLLRRALQRGAWVHTPSAFIATEVVELLGAPAERVRAVHHGVPPVAIGDGEVGRAAAGSDRYVLALGTIEPRKDLPTLVHAFDSLAGRDPALRLVVAGPDGWGTEAYDEAVGRARHRDRVVRLGWVTGAVRSGLLAGAAAFAYPSLYEGFGFPPLEAMQVGVPVVATRAGALPEVLGDAARLVSPRDVDGLAAALADVLENETVRDDLVARGRARAESYSWDRCGDGLTAMYGDAVRDR